MLRYQLFPRSVDLTDQLKKIIKCFDAGYEQLRSPKNTLNSDGVLRLVRPHFEALGFTIEAGKSKGHKILVPVLFGLNNKIDQSFNVDGLSGDRRIVLEVEAGRAVANYQFLKDVFQASMMYGVQYLVLAVGSARRSSTRGCVTSTGPTPLTSVRVG